MTDTNQLTLSQKVIIISFWAPPMVGGPQFLYNLFSRINPSRYSIVTSYQNVHVNNSTQKGDALPCPYFYFDRQDDRQSSKGSSWYQRMATFSLSLPFIGYFINQYLTLPFIVRRFTKTAINVVQSNGGELLLGISDNGPSILTTYFVHLRTGKPYTLFLFDLYRGNLLKGLYRFCAVAFERRIFLGAKEIFVTNEATRELYIRRYGPKIRVKVIHNSASMPTGHVSKVLTPEERKTLVFTGNIGWPQEQAVVNIIRAVKKLQPTGIRLDLYIPHQSPVLSAEIGTSDSIRVTSAPQQAMPSIQAQAGLLILPLSWNTKAPEIIATATPGKFTEYLRAGRPLLVHAPDYSYISQYAKKNKLGYIVDQNNVDLLAATILEYISHPQRDAYYARNSNLLFQKNHEVLTNARTLVRSLNESGEI